MFAQIRGFLLSLQPNDSIRLAVWFFIPGLLGFGLAACQPSSPVTPLYSSNLTWLNISLASILILAVAVVLGAVSARFTWLNNVIRSESIERQKLETSLHQLKEQYNTVLFEKAPFPILISHSQAGNILYINQHLADTLDMDREHINERQARDFFADPRDYDELIRQLSLQGDIQGIQVGMLTTHKELFWVEMSASLIDYENNPSIFLALMDTTKNEDLKKRLESLTMTDDLTGLLNRNYFFSKGQEEIKRVQRYPQPLSLLMLDIDNLKQFNDLHGHLAVDSAIKEFSLILLSNLREVDIVGRVGGDEFGILMPNTTIQQAVQLAERLRQKIAGAPIFIAGSRILVTVSIGVSFHHDTGQNLMELLHAASKAVDQAKNTGRNCVVVAGENLPPI